MQHRMRLSGDWRQVISDLPLPDILMFLTFGSVLVPNVYSTSISRSKTSLLKMKPTASSVSLDLFYNV